MVVKKVLMLISGAIAAGVAMGIALPLLIFWGCYLGGMILNYFVGGMLVEGLNLLLDTERFTKDVVPLLCGTLGVIGMFFRSFNVNTK